MADSVVRLRIDSQEYDAKLKRAGDALSRYFDTVRKGGGTLEYLDDGVMDAVKALGEMETQANSAKGKMREYTEAITSLTAQYRQMSDAEKNGAIGKEMKRSLDELKKKAADLNDVMADTNTEIKNLASDTAFSDGMSLMARSVGNVGTAIVALTGDSEDMKRVLMDIAKIQSTVQAIDSLTKAFQKQNLVLLKNPYVLVASAIAAMGVAIYECVSKTDEETSALRDMNKELDATASKADIASKSLQDLVQSTIIKNYVDDSESEFNKNLKTYIEGQNKTEELWREWQKSLSDGTNAFGISRAKSRWEEAQRETDAAYQAMQKYQARIQTFSSSFAKGGSSANSGSSGGRTSGGVVGSMNLPDLSAPKMGTTRSVASLEQSMSIFQRMLKEATTFEEADFAQRMMDSLQRQIDAQPLALKMGISTEMAAEIMDQWGELREGIQSSLEADALKLKLSLDEGVDLKQVTETAKDTSKAWSAAASAVSQFGSALQQVEDPSAKIAGIIGQAVANIALGFAQATASPATGAAGVFGWIAAATAGLSTMAATIAAIKKTTAGSFANGGVIPGNSYSGDNQWAQVNAGEVILSRAQAGSVASQLESSESSSQPHNSYISGEQIVTVVNAYGRRTGRGEILN